MTIVGKTANTVRSTIKLARSRTNVPAISAGPKHELLVIRSV